MNTEYEETLNIVRKAIKWLKEIQNRNDGGFPGNKPGQRSGLWTTAGVILALLQCGEKVDDTVLNGVRFLIDPNNQNADGGWSTSIKDERSVTEPTAWTVWAFSEFAKEYDKIKEWEFFEKFKESFRRGVYWLLWSNETGGNPPREDGAWSSNIYDEKSRTLCTSLAVRALLESKEAFRRIDSTVYDKIGNEIVKKVENAVKWLTSTDIYKCGYWAWTSGEEKGSIVATAHALLSIIDATQDRDTRVKDASSILKSSIRWLKAQQDGSGKWENELEDRNAGWICLDFFATPWVILALIKGREKIYDFNILQGVVWLRENFDKTKGYWQFNGKEMYTWPTSDAIYPLNLYLALGEKENETTYNTILSLARKLGSYKVYKSAISKLEMVVTGLSATIVWLLAGMFSIYYSCLLYTSDAADE